MTTLSQFHPEVYSLWMESIAALMESCKKFKETRGEAPKVTSSAYPIVG